MVLLLVSYMTVMFHLGYLISLTHLCFIAFLSMYIVLTEVLIYSAALLQECLINLPTYLLTYPFNSQTPKWHYACEYTPSENPGYAYRHRQTAVTYFEMHVNHLRTQSALPFPFTTTPCPFPLSRDSHGKWEFRVHFLSLQQIPSINQIMVITVSLTQRT